MSTLCVSGARRASAAMSEALPCATSSCSCETSTARSSSSSALGAAVGGVSGSAWLEKVIEPLPERDRSLLPRREGTGGGSEDTREQMGAEASTLESDTEAEGEEGAGGVSSLDEEEQAATGAGATERSMREGSDESECDTAMCAGAVGVVADSEAPGPNRPEELGEGGAGEGSGEGTDGGCSAAGTAAAAVVLGTGRDIERLAGGTEV